MNVGRRKKTLYCCCLLVVVCRLLFGLVSPPIFFRVASLQIFLSAVQYRSPRVLRLCERTILLVCTTLNYGTGHAENEGRKKYSFRSIQIRSEIGNSKKIAKKLKKIITTSFQGKTRRERLRMREKKNY